MACAVSYLSIYPTKKRKERWLKVANWLLTRLSVGERELQSSRLLWSRAVCIHLFGRIENVACSQWFLQSYQPKLQMHLFSGNCKIIIRLTRNSKIILSSSTFIPVRFQSESQHSKLTVVTVSNLAFVASTKKRLINLFQAHF